MPGIIARQFIARLKSLVPALLVTALVAGCQLARPAENVAVDGGVTPNAVTGGAIEVTALDAPPGSVADAAAADAALAAGAAPAEAELAAVPTAQADLAAAEAVVEPTPPPKSEEQLACERRKGTWASLGGTLLRTCVFPTRDGGKQCTRESQCEGLCLARSGTCAPFKPLLGCNEILQDNGARVTQCIE